MARELELPVRKIFSISQKMADEIDDFRFSNRIGSEAEAIRQLVELGLKMAEQVDKR